MEGKAVVLRRLWNVHVAAEPELLVLEHDLLKVLKRYHHRIHFT